MARGGRVGFANGSPNPMEEMATLRQAIASNRGGTELKDQFLYDTSPIGKLDKNIFGINLKSIETLVFLVLLIKSPCLYIEVLSIAYSPGFKFKGKSLK